jgi:glycosyltransferase involved in cell wall biosynthesis
VSRWHLITGEYPPGGGGIGDYTRLLALALAERGEEVDVWTSASPPGGLQQTRLAEKEPQDGAPDEPRVHRAGALHGAGLRALSAGLDAAAAPRRLLIQYAPQAVGMRGLNVAFCAWALARRRAGDDVRVMFHEPFFPFGWQRPQRNLLAAVNRGMAGLLLRASTRAYVSTSAWTGLLRPLAPRDVPITTLPIPSTIPFVDQRAEVSRVRARLLAGRGGPLLVHFGTYGEMITPLLIPVLREAVRRHPDARILLLGRGGPAFADRLRAPGQSSPDTVVTLGELDAEQISIHLQAADAALQPYPDGADTRRTTLMACVVNGVPTVTNDGRFTDAEWREGPVRLAQAAQPEEMAGEALDRVLAEDRDELGGRTRAWYQARFSMPRTVETLLADGDGAP